MMLTSLALLADPVKTSYQVRYRCDRNRFANRNQHGGLSHTIGRDRRGQSADANVDVSLATGDIIHAINGASVETLDGLRSSLDHLSATPR